MSNTFDDSICVFATGLAVASTGVATAAAAVPNALSGERPRYVRVAATQPSCVKFGVAGVVATTGDTQVQPGDAVTFSISGATHFSVIAVGAGGNVNIVPLENQ